MKAHGIMIAAALVLSAPAFAQWLNYPTPGIPRLPDGQPNLEARASHNSGRQAGPLRALRYRQRAAFSRHRRRYPAAGLPHTALGRGARQAA